MFLRKLRKPPSGYVIYAGEVRKKLLQDKPDAPFGEISREVGLMWRQMPMHERDVYERKAQLIKRRMADEETNSKSLDKTNQPEEMACTSLTSMPGLGSMSADQSNSQSSFVDATTGMPVRTAGSAESLRPGLDVPAATVRNQAQHLQQQQHLHQQQSQQIQPPISHRPQHQLLQPGLSSVGLVGGAPLSGITAGSSVGLHHILPPGSVQNSASSVAPALMVANSSPTVVAATTATSQAGGLALSVGMPGGTLQPSPMLSDQQQVVYQFPTGNPDPQSGQSATLLLSNQSAPGSSSTQPAHSSALTAQHSGLLTDSTISVGSAVSVVPTIASIVSSASGPLVVASNSLPASASSSAPRLLPLPGVPVVSELSSASPTPSLQLSLSQTHQPPSTTSLSLVHPQAQATIARSPSAASVPKSADSSILFI
ncbi:unnamed protein product [Protopolystoma xenopodis]|uniref:HMG box domain-containing protein n=1 Tax=Protopolystoma xenopodis TaxID=117903 RepID=A0A3S5BMZ7_9PLAT|nr:unnamed protein product [Protopolystoma xenopodis]